MQSALRGMGMLCMLWWGSQAMAQPARALPPPRPTALLQVAGAEVPVQLRQVVLDGRVAAGLGETRVEMEFFNPNARVLEGQLSFPLAEGQQVAGFALDIDGTLRDAVPVPKDKGRQVFEAIERRQVDPGLLEQTAGNQFRLRVYPIPARGTRKVVLTFRDTLPVAGTGLQWNLPLQFAAGAQQVAVRLEAVGMGAPVPVVASPLRFAVQGGTWRAQWQGPATALPGHAQWRVPLPRAADVVAGEHIGERYLLAQLPVPVQATPRAMPSRIGLLWDASGSAGQRDRAAELAVLDAYFRAVGDGQVTLTVLRDRAEPVRRFSVRGGNWQALRTQLEALVPDGASALGDWTPQADVQEYLLVSDGLANYGQQALPALRAGQRLFALSGAGASTDVNRLRAWTAAHHGQAVVLSGTADVAQAVPRLLQQRAEVTGLVGEGVDALVADTGGAGQGWLRVAGRVQRGDGHVRVHLRLPDGRTQVHRIAVQDARAVEGGLVPSAWANATLQQWAADPRANAGAIRALSTRFGLVSADTSLLVLDTLADYLRYGIRAPQPLRAEYDRLHAVQLQDQEQLRRQRLDTLAQQFAARETWWNTPWPKGTPPLLKTGGAQMVAAPAPPAVADAMMAAPMAEAAMMVAAPAPAAAPARRRMAPPSSARAERQGSAKAVQQANTGAMTIALAPWAPDSAYARRLRGANADQLYAVYLEERAQHAGSSAFYLDVADLLFEKGQRDLALRVLSNLAEMDLENRHVLRVLGYRLLQAGAPAQAVPVFGEVLRLGGEEPQSFRDLGLALEANGQYPAALAALHEVVLRPWDARFDGISLIALDELATLAARERLDLRAVDPRLRRAMPLDLRVVLSWDSDNSDMDLWVTDPNGERAYYGNRLTYQGGQMSQDFTGGYGPEQFSLRTAKPGTYKVEANFFGSREQLVTGATTLSLRLSTHWGMARQRDQQVTMRLKDKADTVLVGEFEVR